MGVGTFAQVVEALAPRLNRAVMSESLRMHPDSQAAGGVNALADELSRAPRSFAAMLRNLSL